MTDTSQKSSEELVSVLLKLAEVINAAVTYQDVLEAVAPILPDCQGLYLNLWENFDYDKANYLEIIAAASITEPLDRRIGHRFFKSEFPFFENSRNERLVVVEDIHSDARIDVTSRTNYEDLQTRAFIRVPFHRSGCYIGSLFFKYMYSRQFTPYERDLVQGIADMGLAAVERIRLLQETSAAIEEMSQLYQVSKAINQAATMPEVLAAIKQLFADPMEVAIFLWEQCDRRRATYLEVIISTDPNLPAGMRLPMERVAGLVFSDEMLVANNIHSPQWVDHPATAFSRWFGLHSFACTNLTHGQGIFAIASYEAYTFSPQDTRLMAAIADLTASALQRFRAQQAEAEAREERERLFIASQMMNMANSFEQILEAVSHIDFDDGDYYLYIFENFDYRTATHIETVATGKNRFMAPGQRISMDELPYLKTYPRLGLSAYEDIPSHTELDEITKATLLSQGTLSNLRFGLVWRNRILGAFGVDHAKVKHYSDREKRMMSALGELVSASVERIRLQRESHVARQRAEQLAEQAQQLATLKERTRLARELHDSVSQTLYGIGLGAQTAQRFIGDDLARVQEAVEYIATLAEAGQAEMRALIFELRPESLETEGLVIALAKQGASLQARHQIMVHMELGDEPMLPLTTKECLYRVLREALHNIIKHAHASEVILRLCEVGKTMTFEIIDNGIGFEVDQEFPGHLGLQSMRERMQQLGGQFVIQSVVGVGTHVTVTLQHPPKVG